MTWNQNTSILLCPVGGIFLKTGHKSDILVKSAVYPGKETRYTRGTSTKGKRFPGKSKEGLVDGESG